MHGKDIVVFVSRKTILVAAEIPGLGGKVERETKYTSWAGRCRDELSACRVLALG